MNYKYEKEEIESLRRYFDDPRIHKFVFDIINDDVSPIIFDFDNFQLFKEFICHIKNIFTLAVKYGANNEIDSKMYFRSLGKATIKYKNPQSDENEENYMLNSFNLLSSVKTTNTNSFICIDENFCSNREIPFINISKLLNKENDLYLLIPFIDAVYYDDVNCYEILPTIAPVKSDEVKYEDLERIFHSLKQNNNTLNRENLEKLTKLVKSDLQNYLIDIHYEYMIKPKIDLLNRRREK